MVKVPYGFDGLDESRDDDPWTKLDTINEYLEECEPIPPYLAQWLGHAIRYSNNDLNEFMRRLELKKKPGGQSNKHDADAFFEWGGRACRYEDSGLAAEVVLANVIVEYEHETGLDLERSTLQSWREKYRKALREARCQGT
tara:strand:+ start:2148 stop:2570 length:423 start_codon:yes stop_codon:yes gene_type:complete